MNLNRWVDDHLAGLDDGSGWQPDATLARARLQNLDGQARIKRRWAWATAAAAVPGLLAFVEPRACATPRGCFQRATEKTASHSAQAAPVTDGANPAPAPVSAQTAKPQAVTPTPQTRPARNYKESGSPDAPIACEIYSDYECPSCAAFYRDTMPLLVAEYVQTGKVKLLHRDFPLAQHTYEDSPPATRMRPVRLDNTTRR